MIVGNVTANVTGEAISDRLQALYSRKERNEISSKTYRWNHLREEHTSSLDSLVHKLAKGLREEGVESAIIAVGSSTFPHDFWAIMRNINDLYDETMITHYRDIDIKVLPVNRIRVDDLKTVVERVLKNAGYSSHFNTNTTMGFSLHIGSGRVTPWADLGYGIFSFSIAIRDGPLVDVILGQEPGLTLAAEEAISKEREANRPFCLLYAPESLRK